MCSFLFRCLLSLPSCFLRFLAKKFSTLPLFFNSRYFSAISSSLCSAKIPTRVKQRRVMPKPTGCTYIC